MPTDYFVGKYPDLTGPATRAVAVTPSDSTVLDTTRALYVGGSGTVVVDMLDSGSAISFVGVPAGTVLPVRVTKVKAATTATSIVALI